MSIEVICAAISLSCALVLISHCKYEDGLVGRSALLLLVGAEAIVIAQAWYEDSYELAPTTIILHIAITLFLVRHTYKFLSFCYWGHYKWDSGKEEKA